MTTQSIQHPMSQPNKSLVGGKVRCRFCKGVFTLVDNSFQEQQVSGQPEGLSQIGIVCALCGAWDHACFDNDRLKAMRDELRAVLEHNARRTKMLAYRTAFYQLQSKYQLMSDVLRAQDESKRIAETANTKSTGVAE